MPPPRLREKRERRQPRRATARNFSTAGLDEEIYDVPTVEDEEQTAARHKEVMERVAAAAEAKRNATKRRRLSAPPVTPQPRRSSNAGGEDDDAASAGSNRANAARRGGGLPPRAGKDAPDPVDEEDNDEGQLRTAHVAHVNDPVSSDEDNDARMEQGQVEEDIAEDDDVDAADPSLAAQLDTNGNEDCGARARDTPLENVPAPRLHTSRTASAGVVDVDVLYRRASAVLTWERILGYLAVCGRAPFSAEQYAFLTGVVASVAGAKQMHEYKTIRRQMSNNLSGWCFPKSSVVFVEDVERPRGKTKTHYVTTKNSGRKPAQACVQLVLPSDWAKMDVSTYKFYADVFEHPLRTSPEILSIERSPIVQRRAPFVGRDAELWSSFEGVPCVTQVGDTVQVPCAARPARAEHSREVKQHWFDARQSDKGGRSSVKVRATLCGSWLIGHVPPPGSTAPPSREIPRGWKEWTDHERALQAKFSRPSPSEAAMETVLEDDVHTQPARAARDGNRGSARTQTRLPYSTNVMKLYPGDQCVLLRAESADMAMRDQGAVWTEPDCTQHCVLVGSLVRQGMGLSAERLVWIDVENREECRATVRYVGTTNVTNLPTWVGGRNGTPHAGYEMGSVKNMGYMPDGSRYLVYRFALYMDGFKQTKAQRDTRSVGGCYLMPLGLSVEARRGSGSPRVLTIASSATSHNKVLSMVMEDISRAACTGVDGIDPYGRRVRIFLDPVTFFGDYPAAALCADVVGHTGNAYCTHCTVLKRDSATGSRILCTPMNHSRRVGFMRTDARLKSIRESALKKDIYRVIGMKSRDVPSSQGLPLLQLSENLSRAAGPERNELGEEVIPLIFESSLSCAAVPDHLFNGLIKNMLHVLFDALDNNAARAAVEKRIGSTARENGLPVTGHILRWGSKGEFKGLNNHTMTTLNCILLCSAPAFDNQYRATGRQVFRLARSLQDFAAAVYFWPVRRIDGDHHADMFTVEGRLKYYGDLQEMARQYLKDCDNVMRSDEEAGAVLDKPNAHRAMELVVHTIPTFGHARNCSEMVLELMHQVFKKWLERNTHENSHLSAVQRALTRDWMGRVFALYKVWQGGDSRERACSELGLRRLILGEHGMILDERQEGVTDFRMRFVEALQSSMRSPNAETMGKCGHISLPRARVMTWEADMDDKSNDNEDCAVVQAGLSTLGRMYKLRAGYECRDLTLCKAARLHVTDKYEGKGRSYKYNEVSSGCVISAVCAETDECIVRDDERNAGHLKFFAVFAIAKGPDGKLWVLGQKMGREENGTAGCQVMQGAAASTVVELGGGVRRAGAAHICDAGCSGRGRGLDVKHTAGVCDGGVYELWTREDGYPPHMG